MTCSICSHPRHRDILVDYAFSKSLRGTAERYGVGYRSIARHVRHCVYRAMMEAEMDAFDAEFKRVTEIIRAELTYLKTPRRRRSIITKPVRFTWSRRAWKRRNDIPI